MVLAEALLRVPDSAPADRLIEEKLAAGAFGTPKVRCHPILGSASAWARGHSGKLSALHPRYEAVSCARVMRELAPRVIELARAAKGHDLNLTIDAEEADRLELSLNIVGRALADPSLAGWSGFGLAVQAYQKRAPAVIDWAVDAAGA